MTLLKEEKEINKQKCSEKSKESNVSILSRESVGGHVYSFETVEKKDKISPSSFLEQRRSIT